MLNLNWLLNPFDKNIFFDDVWQKRPKVLTTERDDYFEKLFNNGKLERVLEFGQPHPPSIHLASATSNEKAQMPFYPDGQLDLDKLRKLYLQDETMILNKIEDFDP